MFKHILFLLLVFIVLGCSSSESMGEEENLTIHILPEELSVSYETSTQTVVVNANSSWAVRSSEEWCCVSPTNGYAGNTTLTLTIQKNESYKDRTVALLFSSVTYKKECRVTQSFLVQEVAITDEVFKAYCVSYLDTDGDGVFSLGEAAAVTSLNVGGLGIRSLAGIERFTALKSLDCSDNNLNGIDLSAVKTLTGLNCSQNNLSALNIQQNINLSALNCSENPPLTSIYVWTGFNANQNFVKPDAAVYIEPEIPMPAGYELVWRDEFNDSRVAGNKVAMPNTDLWRYETGASGWGNNEIENYVAGLKGQDTCAMIYDGTLKIIAKKVGSEVLSIRMNTSDSWTYGYFEARLKLPQGKGTWPAFWMLPKNFRSWPDDGEIDIMEEVGYRPNWVAASIHCKAYYHSIGTQKTAETYVETAESGFHVYAVEWTADYIKGLVDGQVYFTFNNDQTNNNDTWPFNEPFGLKLNLAWGGNWGGAHGVDESALPATYEIDYVRVFQKN